MKLRPSRFAWSLAVGLACLAVAAASNIAHAQLACSGVTLTPYAISNGFTCTTYATGFPTISNTGPIGIAYRSDGNGVLVTDVVNGTLYLLASHDDGEVAPVTPLATYGADNALGLAQISCGVGCWKYFMAQRALARIVEIDEDGVILRTVVSGISGAIGIVPFPPGVVSSLSGHLFVTGTAQIWDVDPVLETKTLFASQGGAPDGLNFSLDGKRLYVAFWTDNVVRAYDSESGSGTYGTQTWVSPVTPGHPDGIAVANGTLAGKIYTNFNNGEIWEFIPPSATSNLIASGGSRGDLIATDPNRWSFGSSQGFPTLLLTQTNKLLRLAAAPGDGFIGPPGTSGAPVCPTAAPCGSPLPAPYPVLDLVPLGHDFGNYGVNLTTGAWPFAFRNIGAGAATGCGPPTLSGNNPADFGIQADSCGTNSLGGGSSCTVNIVATPSVIGVRTATLSRTCSVGGAVSTNAEGITVYGVDLPVFPVPALSRGSMIVLAMLIVVAPLLVRSFKFGA